jgi:BON domain
MSTLSHDRQLEARVRRALMREHALSGSNIDVRVENGFAKLRGVVDDDELRRKAEHVAAAQRGITGVSNLLAHAPDWGEEAQARSTEFKDDGDAKAEIDPAFNTKDSF